MHVDADPTETTLLALPQVTLCAVTSVNVAATVHALQRCLEQASFGQCILLTDALLPAVDPQIRVVPIRRIGSSSAYSEFLLTRLVDHIPTSHCLIVQWDGHVTAASRWRPQFLEYDYIGASWPQFDDGRDVGNGGFSLRSRRLMEACRAQDFMPSHPEDVAIGRTNRHRLEAHGMRFAPRDLADCFSAERAGCVTTAFGYHGIFNMPEALGIDAFWRVYRTLDDLGTVGPDLLRLLHAVGRGRGGRGRVMQMIADHVRSKVRMKLREE